MTDQNGTDSVGAAQKWQQSADVNSDHNSRAGSATVGPLIREARDEQTSKKDGLESGEEKAAEENGTERDEEKTSEKDRTESDGVPYDRGWAWAVAFGCFINYALYAGYLKCYSLFYVELLERFDANATETALFFSMRTAFLSIGSLFVMNVVVGHLGVRKTALIGGILISLSGILPSLSNDLMTIICLQGICLGLGQSMIMSPGEVLMGGYFREKRAVAMPLAKCGASVGSITMPLLITLFLQTYGLSGAQLLTGGLCLHALIAAMLFRPLSYFTRRKDQRMASTKTSVMKSPTIDKKPEATQPLIKDDRPKNGQESTPWKPAFLASSVPDMSPSKRVSAVGNGPAVQQSLLELSHQHGKKGVSSLQQQEWSSSVGSLQGATSDPLADVGILVWSSACNLRDSGRTDVGAERHPEQSEPQNPPAEKRKLCAAARCPKVSSFMLDFSLFRRPLFRLLLAYFVLFNTVNYMTIYLPAAASENGVTDAENGVLLSVIGGLDLVCRILCAVVAGCKLLRVPTMIILTYLVLGVAAQFVRFLSAFPHFLAMATLLGLLGGVANCMLPVLVLEFVGLDLMAKALGFVLLTCGASASASFPLLGYIRDLTGSYVMVYHVIGVGAILGAGLLCCEKCVKRLENDGKKDPGVDSNVP